MRRPPVAHRFSDIVTISTVPIKPHVTHYSPRSPEQALARTP